MTVNYDSGLYGYDQPTVTFDGTDTSPAKTRFVLDTSTLNDFGVGLDGAGYPFGVTATANATFGGLVATVSATVVHVVPASGMAELGGVAGVVVAQVAHSASGSAVLGSVSGAMSATVVHSVVAVAGLGAGVATAVSSVLVRPYGDAVLGSLSGSAQATVVPQPPAPTPSYPSGGNPWYRKPRVVVDEPVVVVPDVLPRLPRLVTSSGSSVVSLSSVAVGEVAWSILEDEAELLLLV